MYVTAEDRVSSWHAWLTEDDVEHDFGVIFYWYFFLFEFSSFLFFLFSNKISNSIVLFFYVGRGKEIIALKTGSYPGLRFGSNPGQLINHDYNQEEKK